MLRLLLMKQLRAASTPLLGSCKDLETCIMVRHDGANGKQTTAVQGGVEAAKQQLQRQVP
jgi:hypothetical protein